MLSAALIDRILTALPDKTIGLVGDLFLDRYLDIDSNLTEPSVETGLDAYQVTGVRSFPGALGTVINNLVALGVGTILPFAIIGDDGEGYELKQALGRMPYVHSEGVMAWEGRRTPTYTKPMLFEAGNAPRELNRLDIKNRTPTPLGALKQVQARLEALLPSLDALIVLDQVSEPECGVITAPMREWLCERASKLPEKFFLADSRERIGLFHSMHLKPNTAECLHATGLPADRWRDAVRQLGKQTKRAVFCTRGDEGLAVLRPGDADIQLIAGFSVTGPIDIVGAGDSCGAGIVCASVAGADLFQAAAFGNLIASITVQQIGVTGTASPEQVRNRWREVTAS